MIGSTISRYKIVSELGRGGMGVVYQAEDTRLKRTVAVKVLPRQGLGDGDDLSRFGREAQAAAALNHPHIATVYEIDEEDGQSFIVMEYVDGPSLKDKIGEGPLKLEEAVRLSIQVASGLEAAHEQGIVHRDIKPANVMLTQKGESKIMDFGLAKFSDQTTVTKTGTTLGTAAYMSPEQARGEKVDHRSDIFALGVVIYEMIAGRMAFQGAYAEAVVYSILNVDPEPLTAIRTGVPMELERIVSKALAKNASERYQGMSDLLVDLRSLEKVLPEFSAVSATGVRSSSRATHVATIPVREPRSWKTYVPWGIAAVATVALVAILSSRPIASDALNSMTPLTFPVELPPTGFLTPGSQGSTSVGLSRDGTLMAIPATVDGSSRLYVRKLDGLELRELPGTDGANTPFFDPSGRSIAYFTDRSLYRISVDGGDVLKLASVIGATSGFWGDNGYIVFKTGNFGMMRVLDDGSGETEVLLPYVDPAGLSWPYHWNPEPIPGRSEFLTSVYYSTEDEDGFQGVSLVDFETGEWHLLLKDARAARYIDPGYIVFMRGSDLMAVQFDQSNLNVSGGLVHLIDNVEQSIYSTQNIHYAVSQSGLIAFSEAGGSTGIEAVRVDHEGQILQRLFAKSLPNGFTLSPKGDGLLTIGPEAIQMFDFNRGVLTATSLLEGSWPLWSPGGTDVAIMGVDMVRLDGTGDARRLVEPQPLRMYAPASFSPDGRTLAVQESGSPYTKGNILTVPTDGSQDTDSLLSSSADERYPAFSPDGAWIAFTSDHVGDQYEVFVQAYPGPGGFGQVSTNGGTEPVWHPDGTTIYFRSVDGDEVFSVSFDARDTPVLGQPKLLFKGDYAAAAPWQKNYDVTLDGESFIMYLDSSERARGRIVVKAHALQQALAKQ